MTGGVPAETTVIKHDKQAGEFPAPAPAFPGAKHDVNGHCIRHSNVRLAQPVFSAEAANAGGEPVKYKTIRKICPSCGMLHSAQNARQLRRKMSQDQAGAKDSVKSDKYALVPKVLPRKNSRGASGASASAGGGNTNANVHASSIRKHGNTNNKKLENQNNGLTSNAGRVRHGGRDRERKEKEIVNSNKKGGTTAQKNRTNDADKEKSSRTYRAEKKDISASSSKVTDADKEKSTRNRAEKKDSSASNRVTDVDKEKSTRNRVEKKDGRQSGTQHDGRHHSPSHAGHSRQHHISGSDRGDSDHVLKKHNHADDIPLTKSPNVQKYRAKVTRSGNAINQSNDTSQLDRKVPLPFKTEEVKEGGNNGNDEVKVESERGRGRERERATGVYMMASGLPLPNKDSALPDNRVEQSEGANNAVKGSANAKQGVAKKEKERCNNATNKNEQARQRQRASNSGSAEVKVQAKKDLNSSKDKPEVDKLWKSYDNLKVPPHPSNKEASRSQHANHGKMDTSKLWESHVNINKETSLRDHHKPDHKRPAGTKKEIHVKKVSAERIINNKNKEHKGKQQQPLRGSLKKHDSTKGNITRANSNDGCDQIKRSGSGGSTADANNATRHHGGSCKNNKDEAVKKKESQESNIKNNRRPAAREPTSNNGEKVRFRRGRSLSLTSRDNSPTRKNDRNEKGKSYNVKNSSDDSRRRRADYQRSKSLPQKTHRKRLPTEYHVMKQKPHSTLSTYRQAFLEEMEQMSIYVPSTIEPTKSSSSEVPSSKISHHDHG